MNLIASHLHDDGILQLTLNDAKRYNPLSYAMIGELQRLLDEARTDNSVRVIILAANGPAFCAGHDLKEISNARTVEDGGLEFFQKMFDACSALMQTIVRHPRPVIAQINGIATAAGCQLVASCDLAIASREAQFATPGVQIGLFCSTPMVAVSRNVSPKHTMEMLLTGDLLPAERAEQIGLINRVTDADALEATTMALAKKIAAKSTMTIATGKPAFYDQLEMPLADAYAHTSKIMVENLLKNDAREGIGAFVEKRVPEWTDS